MSTKRIVVTQDDIDQGKPCNPDDCPVARAMRRTLGKRVIVCNQDWCIDGEGGEGPLPTSVLDWIDDFDNGIPTAPFEFSVEVT